MRVGILTFHAADNYGAVLQACGLARVLRRLGHEPIILDYRPEAARRVYGRWGLRSGAIAPTLSRRWRFYRFRRGYLPLSSVRFFSPDDLKRHPQSLDAIVAGSDQIWNTASYRGYDPAFFLGFADAWGARRISYAASVGSAVDFGPNQDAIAADLARFDDLSVRDTHSKEMVEQTSGRKSTIALDPVFLASFDDLQWLPRKFPPESIVVYCLKQPRGLAEMVKLASSRLGLPTYSLGFSTGGTDHHLRGIGPVQWLTCLRRASFVITNSFHGLSFAIKYQKPFAVVPHEDMNQQRLDDLLGRVDLTNHVVRNHAEFNPLLSQWREFDFTRATHLLDRAISRSVSFIHEALA